MLKSYQGIHSLTSEMSKLNVSVGKFLRNLFTILECVEKFYKNPFNNDFKKRK